MLWPAIEEGVSMAGKQDDTDIAEPKAIEAEGVDESLAGVGTESKTAESAAESAAVDPDAEEDAEQSEAAESQRKSTKAKMQVRVSVSVRTLLLAGLITALLASLGVVTWLYLGANAKLEEQARQAANNSHAERIALDYAIGAAKINAQDMDTWKKNLVKGTTPELKEKLSSAATSMQQILVPLQWNSTAVPLVAKVRSTSNGIYVVDTFVGVETKTMQAPEGLQSTATYSITIDSNHDWQISDVGGIGSVVGQK
jgi:Mce-associated membrane protein